MQYMIHMVKNLGFIFCLPFVSIYNDIYDILLDNGDIL